VLIQFQPSAMCRVANQQPRLPRATSSLALNACRDGASTASLGNLFQCVISLWAPFYGAAVFKGLIPVVTCCLERMLTLLSPLHFSCSCPVVLVLRIEACLLWNVCSMCFPCFLCFCCVFFCCCCSFLVKKAESCTYFMFSETLTLSLAEWEKITS